MRTEKLWAMFGMIAISTTGTIVLRPWPATAATTLTTHAVFTNPYGTADEKQALNTELDNLIDNTPTGASIYMSMFYESDPQVQQRLLLAHERGVNVQVVFDYSQTTGSSALTAVWNAYKTALGTDTTQASFAFACGPDSPKRGCIANNALGVNSPSIMPSINHEKFVLFTHTYDKDDVIFESSANLSDGRDNTQGWNDALVLVDEPGIFQHMLTYFQSQARHLADNNVYVSQPPYQSSDGHAKIHFFPRAASPGADPYRDPSTDTIMTVLNNVDCFGNSIVGTTDGTHRTIIRIASESVSRIDVAKKLWDLDKEGCYVEVAETFIKGSATSQPYLAMQELLKPVPAPATYGGPVVYYYCNHEHPYIHSKYLQIEGKYFGVPDRSITWMGSANLTTHSLRQDDETILQWEGQTPGTAAPPNSVFAQFRENFRTIRDSAVGTTGEIPIHITNNGEDVSVINNSCPSSD